MTRHEVVNDVVAGVPLVVTYCPLCNTAIVFEREMEGRVFRFGVSGLLRNSDLVMWDELTESLWQQITGEGLVGELAGTNLTFVPSSIVRWADFRDGFSSGDVLSRETGFPIDYGANPYVGYSTRQRPFGFFQGEIDERFPALERVVGVTIGDASKSYPFSTIADARAVNDSLAGTSIVVLWGAPDTADALDTRDIARGQAVGTGVAFKRSLNGRVLTFTGFDDDSFIDTETGSKWNILGKAVEGPLAGSQLSTVVHRNEFWFAWTAFFPDAPVYGAD